MRVLDLFCGAGGASMGYYQAEFEVVGVDINPQPNYPFTFIQADVFEYLNTPDTDFDLIHASPPCQRFSVNTPTQFKLDHPDLVAPVRRELDKLGRPYLIENVPGAPIRKDLVLCGSMFGLQVQRHRWFELSGFSIPPLECNHIWADGRPHTVTGHADGAGLNRRQYLGFRDTKHAADLMDMPWCTRSAEITEAIPPAYTKYIGEQFRAIA